jgi:hypothetical protein
MAAAGPAADMPLQHTHGKPSKILATAIKVTLAGRERLGMV